MIDVLNTKVRILDISPRVFLVSHFQNAQHSTQKVKNTIYTKRYSYSSSARCRIRNNINIRYIQVDSIQQFISLLEIRRDDR